LQERKFGGGRLGRNMRERIRRGKENLEVDEPHPTALHSGVWYRSGRENMGQEKGPRTHLHCLIHERKVPLNPQHNQLGAKAKLNSYYGNTWPASWSAGQHAYRV